MEVKVSFMYLKKIKVITGQQEFWTKLNININNYYLSSLFYLLNKIIFKKNY